MSDDPFWTYFFELFESIPRQGPGLNSLTAKALRCLPTLTSDRRILDIGCGAGVQTLEVARNCAATLVATDLHAPFLETLKRNAEREGLSDRITTQVADMAALPFDDASFDVIWVEGASFIVGFKRGLSLWQRLLKPGGHLVISEFTWFRDDIPTELREFCVPDPQEDASLAARRREIAEVGYTLLEDFRLPREAWWETYYLPLIAALDDFEPRHADNPEALAVAKRSRQEISLFKRYEDLFGYAFYILKR